MSAPPVPAQPVPAQPVPAQPAAAQPAADQPVPGLPGLPVLSGARRRLWRDPQTLQLGRAGPWAVVLAGLDPGARAVLALLDGTRDVAAVHDAAVAAGCPAPRVRELLDLLASSGLLVDAAERWPAGLEVADRDRLVPDHASLQLVHGGSGLAVLRRRRAARVAVHGGGRTGAPLAALLAAAGVGTVDVVDDGTARAADVAVGGLRPADAGRRRGSAAGERVREVAPGVRAGPVVRPDLAVLAPAGALDDRTAAALLAGAVPHLLVQVRDTVGTVGPLVLPGRTACLRCLDLTRTDRDPGWPVLAVQLATDAAAPAPCDAVLAAAVAAQAAAQALALLDGRLPAAAGGTLELALPDWRWRRRTWPVHPACSCGWAEAG